MNRASTDPGDPLAAPNRVATQRADALSHVNGRRSSIAVDSLRRVRAAISAILAGARRGPRTRDELICDVLQD